MKNIFRKITISIVTSATLALSIVSINANAATNYGYNTNGNVFNNEWEMSVTIYNSLKEKIGVLCFGYDTDWINEDYAWAKGADKCKAGVYRHNYDNSTNWGWAKSGWSWSKEEVTHKKNNVSYYIEFPNNEYSGSYTSGLYSSSNKG